MMLKINPKHICIIAILILIFPLFFSLAEADVVISNVSPPDDGIHIEIENNPPDQNGYVNLSFQLNDTTGGGDMEFYLDVLSPPKWSGNGSGYWSYYREIWIDNTGGSEINNSYINITLNSTNFDFSHAQPDGDDIRFIDNASDILSGNDLTPNTVRLWYNSSNQSAKFSVKIPNIPANTNYRIWIAYGNDRASWTGLSTLIIYENDYSTDPSMQNPSIGRYIIHSNISFPQFYVIEYDIKKVSQSIGKYGHAVTFGAMDSSYNTEAGTIVSCDTDHSGISSNEGIACQSGTSYGVFTELTDTNWHHVKMIVNESGSGVISFYIDDVFKYNQTLTDYTPDGWYLTGSTASYMSYDIAEWDSSEKNMHFKVRRTDSGTWLDFRYDNLSIYVVKPIYSELNYTVSSEIEPSVPLGVWTNRLHLTDQNNNTWYHHEDTFNRTNTTYYWRIHAKDGTTGVWTNQTFSFRTDAKPSVFPVYPENNSYKEAGNIELSAVVYHPDYTFGWTGLDFDGANDDVRVPDDPSLNLTSSFTIDMALWIEDVPADDKFDTIISKMTDANTGWGVAIYSEDGTTWELHICVDGHNKSVGNATLPTETWIYVTVVFDNDTHTVYVYRNGTLVYSYYEPNTPSPNTADVVIGECSYVGNDKTFDGKMDYIRVYNVALTPSEVKANFYGKNDNCVKRGLVSWWKFDENTGTTTYDSWGNNDGTLEDGTAWATGGGGSTTYYGKIYNVTFYEYPSGRIIGWNSTDVYDYAWWNITINNTGSALTNYPVKIEITNPDFFNYAQEKADIRVYDADKTTLLPYWIETFNKTSNECIIWVNVTSIPSGNKYIYIYTNESLTTDESNGSAVFDFFDDFSTDTTSEYERFDPDKWDYYFRYGYGAKGIASWTMEITDIDAINWGGGIYIGMSGENGTTITNRTYFKIFYNTDIGATETTAVVRFCCQNSSGSTDSGSWDAVLTEGNTYEFKIIVTDTYCRGIITTTSGSEVFNETLTSYIPEKLEYQWIGLLNYNDAGSVFEWSSSEGGYLHIKCQGAGFSGTQSAWIDTKLYYYKLLFSSPPQEPTVSSISKEDIGIYDAGWTNGEIVKCNVAFYAPYEGTKYYWYAKAKDDEYWSDPSPVYVFTTYYNDTEPNIVYYSLGADIYVQPEYTEPEPDIVYYSLGSQINVYYMPEFSNLQPANGSEDVWLSTKLSADVQKGGDYTNWDIVFYTNDTVNGSWVEIGRVSDVVLGGKKISWWNVTIDNSANANSLTNYTAEITITDEDFFNLTSGKENIRVFDADKTTPLDYYIDVYDSTNKIARIYVKIPSIPANSVKYIYIHTNETYTTDLSNISKVATIFDDFNDNSIDPSWQTVDRDGVSGTEFTETNQQMHIRAGGDDTWRDYDDFASLYQSVNGNFIATVKIVSQENTNEWAKAGIMVRNDMTTASSGYVFMTVTPDNGYSFQYDNDNNGYLDTSTKTSSSSYPCYLKLVKNEKTFTGYYSLDGKNWVQVGTATISSANTIQDVGISVTSHAGSTLCLVKFDDFAIISKSDTELPISVSKESEGQYIIPSTISVWFSGLDWNTTYYWKVGAYNSTMDRWFWSDIYHFTTLQNDTEPNIAYYSLGADIYVQPEYTDTEPNIVYYSLGAEINVYNIANLSNPYPADGSTNVWLSTPLRIDVNKTGDVMQLDIVFETNCTANGSWVEIGRVTQSFPPNATIQIWFSGLDWNTTYYWRVRAVNTTTGMTQYSDIYHFTTLATDQEPNIVYYSLGADIYVQPVYNESEPNIVYYSIGANISIGRPSISDPIPENNTAYGPTERDFSVYISDDDANDTIDKVEFYIDGGKYGEVLNVSANSRATIHITGLTNWTWHTWYVKVYDDEWVITSDLWRYRPANHPPVIDEDPDNGSTNVAVYRKLVSGEWQHFVRLYWNITDGDGDGMNFILWVKDPSTGDWIQRWTILDYSMYNGSYYQDEKLFNETGQTYYWKVWVSDGKNETTQIFHFFTQFFIDFWWYPEYPTTDDTVHFYSITEGADDWKWEFGDGTNVTGVNETTHQYLVAGYYNVTLWVYNATNDVWGYLTKTIRVDRNVTLLTPEEGTAGYNWFAWQGNTTNASKLAELLNLSKGYWIHYYNASSDEWEGYFVGYNAGINSVINNWDATVIVVNRNITRRINVTDMYNYSIKNRTFMKTGYNVVSWSSYSERNASELPLESGEWAYKYDTVNRAWKAYLKGVGGDDFKVKPYDVIVTYLKNSRWWNLMFGG